jgi:hypothetical protein
LTKPEIALDLGVGHHLAEGAKGLRLRTQVGSRIAQCAAVAAVLLLVGAGAGSGATSDGPAPDSITQLPSPVTLPAGGSQTFDGQTLHLAAAPPQADILLALDTTGSMGAAINDAKNDAASMVGQIRASIPGARFAVADFKDFPISPFGNGGDYPWRVDQDFTANTTTGACALTVIECALNGLTAGGGNDTPEAYNFAFYEAYSDTAHLSWRDNTPRFMVVLGDSLPHDAGFNADFSSCPSTPNNDPGPDGIPGNGDDLRTLPTLTALKAAHTNLSFVTYNPSATVAACQADMAAFTGGSEITHDTGTAALGNQIVSLIRQAAANIDTVKFTVTGRPAGSEFGSFDASTWVAFSPSTFGPAVAPIDLGFSETVSVPAGTALGTYTLTVSAVVDGSVRATQTFDVDVRSQAVSALTLTADQSSNVPGIAQIPLSSIPVARIPAFAGGPVSTPGGSIPGGSIPGGSIPGGSIPGGSIPGGSIPGGSITFGDLGLAGGLPGGSIPGGSIPGGSIPGGSIGFQNALQSVLLSQIPLTVPADGATWPAVLAGTPLDGRPLNTITLYEVTQNSTAWSRLAALPLRDVPFVTSLWGGVPLAAWLLGNAPLADLPAPGGGSWASALDANGGSSAGLNLSTNTVFGVAVAGQLGRTNIGSIPGGSIPGGSIVGGTIPARAIPLSQIVAKSRLATVPLSTITQLSGIVLCGAFSCSNSGTTLGDAAAAGAIDPGATYGLLLDRTPSTGPAAQMTISELIFAFLPASLYPWEQLNLQGLQDVAGTGKNIDYHLKFVLDCSITTSFSVRVKLPSGEFVVPGSSSFSYAGGANQAAANPNFDSEGGSFSWTPAAGACPTGAAARQVQLNFSAYERLAIGRHTASASVTANNLTTSANDQAPVDVTQAGEPNDTPANAQTLQKDVLYVGHIAYSGDQDVYSIPLDGYPRGTKVKISMKVPADLDLVVTKPNSPSVRSAPGGSIPGGSIPLEDPTPSVDSSGTPLPPDTLADVPQSAPGGSIPGGSIPGGSIPGGSIPGGSISANRGNVSEAAQIVTNGETGNAYVTVSGYNGASSLDPYVLRLQVTPPPTLPACPAVTGMSTPTAGTLPSPSSLPADTQTLFLVDRQRMAALHDGTNAMSINTLLSSTTSPLVQVASRPEVKGAIIPVDGNVNVRNAYASWDASPCSIDAVNGVVKSINDLVDTYRAALPNVKYIVLLGDDRAIPSWRQFDRVSISPEVDEAGELQNFTDASRPANPLFAAAAQNYVLTDGAYGVRKRITWLGADLPLPQDVVSRFVESTDDIGAQLSAYASSGSVLNPQSEFVSGDDFFADSALSTDRALQAGFPGATADFLYPPSRTGWTRNDFLAHFFSRQDSSGNPLPVPDVGGLYAHYNPWLAQPAAPTPPTNVNQLVSSADASATPALKNHILFTIGCHSGLNIPDGYPLLSGSTASKRDWAQTYARGGAATYIANTGFGYDDTDSVALSGRLMTLFAQKLNRGTGSIGQQWIDALDTYYRTAGDWDVLDEKVMLEATFYGPPWAHFGSPQPKPSPPALTTHDVGNPDGTSVKVATLPTIAPTIHSNAGTNGGTWWDIDGQTLSVPFRPIQPLYTQDVTISGQQARDAWITGLTVNDLANQTPVRAHPAIDRAAYEPDPEFRNIFWPATPTTVLHSGFGDTLNVVAGQFRPVSIDLTSGIERQLQSIGIDLGYSSSTDTVRPLISQVAAVMTSSSQAHIAVRVTDNSGTVARVAVLYNDGTHNFRRLDLGHTGGDLWEGTTPSDLTGPIETIAEAADDAWNVAMSANKAVNFTATTDNSAPSITIENPLANAVLTLNQKLPARYFCSDAGGVQTCSGPSPNGGAVDTTTVGTHTFTVTATDFAGHTSTRTVSYVVRYSFSGFLAPIDNPPTMNQVKAGQTVPIKWDLKDAGGNVKNDLAAVTSVRWETIRCPSATGDPDAESVTPGLSGLKILSGHFQYNWATLTTWVGTCWKFSVTFADSTTQSALFQVK